VVILDMRRITSVDEASGPLLTGLDARLEERRSRLALSTAGHLSLPTAIEAEVPSFDSSESALSWAADDVLRA
jgi:hypothetical protein